MEEDEASACEEAMTHDPDLAFRLMRDIERDLKHLLGMQRADISYPYVRHDIIEIERLVFEIGEKLEGKNAA